ncbi:unnamed protein product [Protopolystoma xenopodis]|uniref:Uncharacterized protein n=1 Tax=Protopolystoma xenopodis TaxID=117903 RepID=A0A3S5CME0_9PLAT|nr:unnamed protein product [Protopolystoma xenopodis]
MRNVFEEIGGLGVWRRYWCQLRADQLIFWLNPEHERAAGQRRFHNSASFRHSANPGTMASFALTSTGPAGRIDLRNVIAPWAVISPYRVCTRLNTLFMRSLYSIEPSCLAEALDADETERNSCTESLVLSSSADYRWLEHKHLLCADSAQEREFWISQLNICLSTLRQWIPNHFAFLQQHGSRLEFGHPVSARLASLVTGRV